MTIRVAQVSTPAEGTTGGTSIVSNSITVQPGNFLHVIITWGFDAAQDISTITDTQSLAQTIFGTITDATNGQKLAHAVLGPTKYGTVVVTANFSGAAVPYREISVKEIADSFGYDAVNVAHHEQLQTAPTTATDAVTSGNTGATTYRFGLISGAAIETGGVATPSTGTGFTSDGTAGTWDLGSPIIRLESKRITAIGVQAATFTAATNVSYISLAVVFLERQNENRIRKILPGHRGPHRTRQFLKSSRDTTNLAANIVSGDSNTTNADDTLAASGSTTIIGTLATTNANDTLAASGSVGAVTGTVNYTNNNDTLSANGTTTITGTLAKTNANDTLSALGTTSIIGSSSTTNADDTLSASGSIGPISEGSRRQSASNRPGKGPFNLVKLKQTRKNFSGAVTPIFGNASITNADDTLAASGTTTVIGTLAKTNSDDTLSASGTTTVTGTLAKTNDNDTLSASGSVGSGVFGTVNYTNANDTSAASGTTTVIGTLAKTNANDTLSASGTTTVSGSLARTNANDTLSASGSPVIVGSLAKTNANDTLAANGSVGNSVSGTVNYTNQNDSVSASGTTNILGTLAKTNANDTLAASGTTKILGTLSKTNANDSVSAYGVSGFQDRDTINVSLRFSDTITRSVKFANPTISRSLKFDESN